MVNTGWGKRRRERETERERGRERLNSAEYLVHLIPVFKKYMLNFHGAGECPVFQSHIKYYVGTDDGLIYIFTPFEIFHFFF